MADPWQECMDYAVTLARKAGEVRSPSFTFISFFNLSSILFILKPHVCHLEEIHLQIFL